VNEKATVPQGTYENLAMTRDWNPLESDSPEYKYYAEGIGGILEEAVGG